MINVGEYGRLANRMWTHANLLAFALEREVSLRNPAFHHFVHHFPSLSKISKTRGRIVPNRPTSYALSMSHRVNLRTKIFPTISLGEHGRITLDDDVQFEEFIRESGIAFLSGLYFCAPDCMARQRNRIRSAFALGGRTEAGIREEIDEIKKRTDLIIGVHIRQGDYREFCDGIMYYSTSEYYDIMKALYKQGDGAPIVFLICSNEHQPIQNFPDLDVAISKGSSIEDLYKLAHCDYIIGPNSSYNQWASWWGNVPLHVLSWRAAVTFGNSKPIWKPRLDRDFAVFSPHNFGRFSSKEYKVVEFE